MASFNLADYEPVDSRIHRFYEQHPEGRIITEAVQVDADHALFRAAVYTDRDDARPAATGYAHEFRDGPRINKDNHVEVCETSAIGRALANLGMNPKGFRPSREEMDTGPVDEATRKRIVSVARANSVTPERAQAIMLEVAGVESTADLPAAKAEDVIAAIKAEFNAEVVG